MKLHKNTRQRITESIHLLHELFHVEVVILTTLAFNNNVLMSKDWDDMLEVNEVIRDVVHHWDGKTGGVKFVLVQDFAVFTNAILWMNAEHLGYDVSCDKVLQASNGTLPVEWKTEGAKFLLHRLDIVAGLGGMFC